jgi:hypothetical protein
MFKLLKVLTAKTVGIFFALASDNAYSLVATGRRWYTTMMIRLRNQDGKITAGMLAIQRQ